ncbi:MAG TPA: sulfate permease [Candidatus Limnocylindrales bacterium]|nr:sulfate permease [Candidatus Limnocylindrales bacterium]
MSGAGGRRPGILGVQLARTYQRSWLRPDLLAAVTVWALLVPQALAYAQLAKVDPVVGLYATIGAAIGYVLLGGVRSMTVGPEGTIALLTATILAPMAAGDPTRYLALAGGLALVASGWLFLSGLIGLGFVTRFLSRPLLMGYVAGSAIVMIVSQLDSMIGVKLVAQDDTLAELAETIRRLGETNTTTLLVGLGVIGVTLLVRRIDRRLPAYLIAVLASIAVSVAADLAGRGVAVVGAIPPGLPPVGLPAIGMADLWMLAGPALAMALLIYADSGVTGQVLGKRGGYAVDGNQEFMGLGAANLGAALTGGFPVNGSQSRSFTAADVGARSQAMNVGVLLLVIVTLLVLTPLFAPLPKSALAGVIIVVGAGLLDPAGFRELARVDRREVALALLTAAIVVATGMLAGVLVTVVLSLFLVALRAAQPRRTLLVQVPGTDNFRSVDSVGSGEAQPGLVIYRFDAPLFFANSTILSDDVLAAVAAGAAPQPVRWVVIDAEAIGEVDSTGAAMLADLSDDLRRQGVTLALARVKAPVAAYLARAGVLDKIGAERVYLEVDTAVAAFRAADPGAESSRP